MKRCVVVNKYKSDYDIDIQRGTKYGNPYKNMPRTQALAMYEVHFIDMLKTGVITVDELKAMAGKRLGCTCKPQCCHGDTIARAVNYFNGIKEPTLNFLEN
ncbi:MAG: DUF4326 domain-containing protein [Cetobacterium sp.]|uniref:DUF4326 domain-containing protein n=1 Tax=Cetobacterium sp. TaxID=2071632 RepID=UPI003EE5F171